MQNKSVQEVLKDLHNGYIIIPWMKQMAMSNLFAKDFLRLLYLENSE